MQIAILNGIYADSIGEFRTAYPRNQIPVPKAQGISKGYLRPSDGILKGGDGPGIGRGGINWNGVCYRVMGTKLVKVNIDGTTTTLGDVGGTTECTLDYSFDRLAVCSNGNFYYWDGSTLTQVTDTDLGAVIDFIWVDGYFLTTDGTYLVVTDLNDPTAVNPLKYGSSEVDPDSIKAVLKLHNEPYAINRYSIEAFQNIGGSFFPFQRISGASINRGAIGTHACAVYQDAIAFVGGGRDESPAVWLGVNAQTTKISTREIDQILMTYNETELSKTIVETKIDKSHEHLLIHLPDQTVVFDAAASKALGEFVWFTLDSGLYTPSRYRAKNLVWCYDKWLVSDPLSTQHGFLVDNISTHYGNQIGWEFNTQILYNEGKGAIVNSLEVVALPGHVPIGANPVIWTSYSNDGETWSNERSVNAGKQGYRDKRLAWFQMGSMNLWRIQKVRGTSDAHLSIARLEAEMEPLNA